MMKIEAGKYYKRRDGRKVGPAILLKNASILHPMCDWLVDRFLYQSDGTFAEGQSPHNNLISEWSEGPIRTVTRREIVLGDYGKIRVKNSSGTRIALLEEWRAWTPEELREAAHLFNQIAEVLEENQ